MTESIGTWLDALQKGMQNVSQNMLQIPEFQVTASTTTVEGNLCGAYLPIIMDDSSMYVGFLSDPVGAASLARALLCMEPGEELTNEDLSDALGEISNMLGGGVQRSVDSAKQDARFGLLIFVQGTVRAGSNVAEGGMEVLIGAIAVKLVLIKGPTSAATQPGAKR